MMASGMLVNAGEWNVGDRWRVECWRMMASECWRMMANGMLVTGGEWNVGE